MTPSRTSAMPDLQVRAAAPSDHEAVQRLTLDAFQEYAALLGPEWPKLRRSLEQALAGRLHERLVVEHSGQLLGSVTLVTPSPGLPQTTPEVQLLAVARRARGLGVGRRLIGACVAQARQRGAEQLNMTVLGQMKAAQALLRQMGFRLAAQAENGLETFEYLLNGPTDSPSLSRHDPTHLEHLA